MLRKLLVFLAAVVFTACSRNADHSAPPHEWSVGFWFWNGSEGAQANHPVDVLFVHVGSINPSGYASLPERLPAAKQYWAVYRFEKPGLPAPDLVPTLTASMAELQVAAERRGIRLAGVQLDIDSPTRQLPEYATFLRAVRKRLPYGWQLSITALLDWFRSGTAVNELLAETDEFVPQFYDVRDSYEYRVRPVAEPIDGPRWAPLLNRYRKRFRIGISSFGRAHLIRPSRGGARSYGISEDLRPLDLGILPDFKLRTSRNSAGETVLEYRATRNARIGYSAFEPGEGIDFILPGPEAIRSAVEQARSIGGYNTGIVFFRWPSFNEVLAEQPDEVLRIVDGQTSSQPFATLRATDRACAAVSCTDLYLVAGGALSPSPVHYRIRSSSGLEYFLPADRIPIRMSAPAELTLEFPPYGARGRFYLGRAVTTGKSEFRLEGSQDAQ